MRNDIFSSLYIVGGVLLIPILVAILSRQVADDSPDDFFLQHRQMGSFVSFFTVAATWWSSYAFLGSCGYFYKYGPLYWTAIAWNIFFGVMFFFVGRKIWYLGKRNGYMTAADFVRHQYGSPLFANIVTFIMIVGTLPYLQMQLIGGATLIQIATGTEIPYAIASFVFYAVIVVSIWIGGQRAVSWSDVLLGVLLFSGMVAGGVLAVETVGGTGQMFSRLAAEFPQHLQLAPGSWMAWLSMFIITPVGSFMAPQTWMSIYAVKKAKTFALMPVLLAFIAMAYMGTMLTGNTGRLLFRSTLFIYSGNTDYILSTILFNWFPFVLASLVLACGIAAALSTANSQAMSLATVITYDIYHRYIDQDTTPVRLIWVGRVASLAVMAVAYIMSLYIPVALVAFGNATLGFAAQLMIPVCGAIFWARSTRAGAVAGTCVGCLLNAVFGWTELGAPGIFAGGDGLFAMLCNLVAFVAVSYMSQPRETELMQELRGQYADYYHGEEPQAQNAPE